MEFLQFKQQVKNRFNAMVEGQNQLFETDIDKDVLWNLYLDSFPVGTNLIFRERREFDCSCCRQFIRNIGGVVIIKNNKMESLWEFETGSSTFQPVVDALAAYVRSKLVSDIYFNTFKNIGTDANFEDIDGSVKQWNHLYAQLPDRLINKSGKSEGDFKGSIRDVKNVFKRSLEEISIDSLSTVLELIAQKSLYKGEEWEKILVDFLKYKKEYLLLGDDLTKDLFAWEQSIKVGGVLGKIKNHSIGTLLINISEDMDLDTAVKKYEAIVAPSNYKRPKAIFTKKMLEQAQATIIELGLTDSLGRRYAKLDDITVNNILFSNKDAAKRIGGADVFADMAKDIAIDIKKFSKVEEISIEDFVANVLPSARDLELYLENKHAQNMVSLIAPTVKESKTMFKWGNNFSWAYSGNVTDSTMKDRVKSAGGNVEGILRFSIQWNDQSHDANDLDAHCIEPGGNKIYFGAKRHISTTGQLDVDIMNPRLGAPAVENITWTDRARMEEGTYKFSVHNFAHRGGRDGFKAEIEFDGQVYSFDYNKELRNHEMIQVAEVTFSRETGFIIKERIASSLSSRDVWGIKTNQFIPVSVAMFSPNYWDEQQGIGHKHYLFMLKDCINSESPNGFYNEFLKNDLLEHKRVFEALGSKLRVEDCADQLSGLGFSSTKRNEVLVKVKGASERVLKIKF